MKIAVSTDSGMVSPHFGRCPEFTIAEIEDGKVTKKEVIENPGHSTGLIPNFLSDKRVEVVIAGGAGFKAKQFFDELGIKLIIGIEGKVDDVIDSFAKGELEEGESFCSPGKGKDYGVAKEDGHHN
ncbi:NifB/NifX family molybdenum-iron cluster-binding protein [Candidatus Woesearchaeota archaeon]|nr:NifB/NifX family molybdenum-iron cluster-binding protein [Candidatus Woesearchaeota archaeon]